MNKVKNLCGVIYKMTFLFFALPATVVGLVYLFKYNNLAWLINGVMWLSISIGLFARHRFIKRKLSDLKKSGICYDATIVKAIPKNMMRIGSYITVQFNVKFTGRNGDKVIKTHYYLLTQLDKVSNLNVKVYVDSNDEQNYAVEIYRKKDAFLD